MKVSLHHLGLKLKLNIARRGGPLVFVFAVLVPFNEQFFGFCSVFLRFFGFDSDLRFAVWNVRFFRSQPFFHQFFGLFSAIGYICFSTS